MKANRLGLRVKSIAFVLTSFMTVSQATARGGDGVGNGTNRYETMQDEYEQDLHDRSTVVGRRGNGEFSPNEWCDATMSYILGARQRAAREFQERRYVQAKNTMKNAFIRMAGTLGYDRNQGGPMVRVLVERAVIIANALDSSISDQDIFNVKSKVRFLFKVAELIDGMDRGFVHNYNEWRYPTARSGTSYPTDRNERSYSFDLDRFEREYMEQSVKQLRFLVDGFIIETPVYGGSEYRPMLNEKVYFRLASLMVNFVANDLTLNYYRYAQACAIGSLRNLQRDLVAQMNGSANRPWATNREAVDAVSRILIDVADEIEGMNFGCFRY